jgi:pimeloyl-ACP methyl ester carboxylesterase
MVRPRTIRISIFILIFVPLLALSPAFIFGTNPPDWLPLSIKIWSFDMRLAIAPSIKKISSISQGSILDRRIYLDTYGEIVIFDNDDLTLVSTIYKPEAPKKSPGIVLLHGSTPEGRKLGLYRLLGRELSDRGYVVLSMDLRGYGESDDPPDTDQITNFDQVEDVVKAIDYLGSTEFVDDTRIFIIGHSAGAVPAISAGVADDRIQKIIAFGPPRRVKERSWDENSPEFHYFQRRTMRYMRLKEPIPEFIFLKITQDNHIENYIDYFTGPNHKPLMLIDGQLESEDDKIYLQQLFSAFSEPKEYLSLMGGDHYVNVANIGPVVVFDQRLLSELVNEIDRWLSDD